MYSKLVFTKDGTEHFDFADDDVIVEFYTYRRARLYGGIIIELNNDDIAVIRAYLEGKGKHIDNHICWKTDEGVCYMYSDRTLTVSGSKNLIVKDW